MRASAALSDKDNKRRPGRYILLQEQEKRVFGTDRVKSSLTDGYAFKKLLGKTKWQEVIPRGERWVARCFQVLVDWPCATSEAIVAAVVAD